MEKNRFSTLLEDLVSVSEVKHSLLAQELQFDVSYISKWISGRVLPSEKTIDDTAKKLSHCLAANASPMGLRQLYQDYQVSTQQELQEAVCENLLAEYYYVTELQRHKGNIIAHKVSYYPWLSIEDFLDKMHHPVLRRVKSLNIMAAIDLFSIENEYRSQIVSLGCDARAINYVYPDVHFSLLINQQKMEQDIVRNTLFITNMLRMLSHVDFRFYRGNFAYGKIMFVVKNELAVSGILIRPDACASVTVCEGMENAIPLYNNIQSLCTREALLFQKMDMMDLLTGSMDYVRSLLAPERSWMLGHVTEHVMPDDLFLQLANRSKLVEKGISIAELIHLHKVSNGILNSGSFHVLVSESAISRFVITGRVDFFNEVLVLDFKQRIKALNYALELIEHSKAQVKIIHAPLVSDFEYDLTPSIFLSGTLSFLRLEAVHQDENLLLKINRKEMQAMCQHFLDHVWRLEEQVVSDASILERFIRQQLQGLELLANTAEGGK